MVPVTLPLHRYLGRRVAGTILFSALFARSARDQSPLRALCEIGPEITISCPSCAQIVASSNPMPEEAPVMIANGLLEKPFITPCQLRAA